MNRPSQRPAVAASRGPAAATFRSFSSAVLFWLVLLFSTATVRSQSTYPALRPVYSVSGQFVVSAVPQDSPLLHDANLAADTNLVRLEPALFAVSAERFKLALWSQLGLGSSSPWTGKIYLTLHPARSADDEVNITIHPAAETWDYLVDLPDIVTRTRFARALTGTLLLELANRNNHDAGHSAELPPWLTDGLAGQLLGSQPEKLILSSPAKQMGGLAQSRLNSQETGRDPLAAARRTLLDHPALTFDQLCWPVDAQMNGADGGAYLASAQLFVANLLGLEQGAAKLRALLAQLPGCLNWQTAFYAVYHQNFKRPLDVEKWWSLRVIRFSQRDPGPRLTAAASRDRLADLLAVPVEFRSDTNALPEHTVVSLQDAIQNFSMAQLTAILEIKRRDFELAQFRMAQPFAGLADGYRAVITDFLGENRKNSRTILFGRRSVAARLRVGVAETVKRLDALDARRREVETKLDATPLPKTLNPGTP